MKQYTILLIPFVLTCVPGYVVSESVIIQAPDILMFFLLVCTISAKCNMSTTMRRLLNMWKAFFFCVLISFFVNTIIYQYSLLSPLLKVYRLCYPLILVRYLWINKYHISDEVNKAVIVSGIGCALWAIYGYFFQLSFLTATQTIFVEGQLVNRAGSFWGDSGVVGLVSCYYVLIGISYILHKSFRGKLWKVFAILCVSVNLVTIALSSSRSGIVSLLGVLVIIMLISRKMSVARIIGLLLVFSGGVYVIYMNNISEDVTAFVDTRVSPLIGMSSNEMNEISSGRVDLWQSSLLRYTNSDLLSLLLGKGYKVDTNVVLADNGFIYVLITTGIIGFILFVRFIFFLSRLLWANREQTEYRMIAIALFSSWLIASFFGDILTIVPANMLLFFYLFLFLSKSDLKSYESAGNRRA